MAPGVAIVAASGFSLFRQGKSNTDRYALILRNKRRHLGFSPHVLGAHFTTYIAIEMLCSGCLCISVLKRVSSTGTLHCAAVAFESSEQ
jgi:hypothetical protein